MISSRTMGGLWAAPGQQLRSLISGSAWGATQTIPAPQSHSADVSGTQSVQGWQGL